MPEQFVNVFKANAEIRRLDAELTKAISERDTAAASLATTQATLAAYDPALEATASQLQTDLTTAQTELTAARAAIVNLAAEVETAKKAGSQQALTITAAQGQPPVSVVPITGTSQSDPVAQYRAISDPAERVRFYRTNKSAIDSAFHNHNPKN